MDESWRHYFKECDLEYADETDEAEDNIFDCFPVNSINFCANLDELRMKWFKLGFDAAQKSRWIPIEERLPETSGDYLVKTLTKDYIYIIEKLFYDVNAKLFMTFFPNRQYIAWQPLPI
jgi:hypothetical protein